MGLEGGIGEGANACGRVLIHSGSRTRPQYSGLEIIERPQKWGAWQASRAGIGTLEEKRGHSSVSGHACVLPFAAQVETQQMKGDKPQKYAQYRDERSRADKPSLRNYNAHATYRVADILAFCPDLFVRHVSSPLNLGQLCAPLLALVTVALDARQFPQLGRQKLGVPGESGWGPCTDKQTNR